MSQRIRNAKAFLEDTLTISEQIELAEAILSAHTSMFLTLTKRDATLRLMERYPNMTEEYATSLAEEFFSTQLWKDERESTTDHYWEVQCGVETLYSPLDDWMHNKGLKNLAHRCITKRPITGGALLFWWKMIPKLVFND